MAVASADAVTCLLNGGSADNVHKFASGLCKTAAVRRERAISDQTLERGPLDGEAMPVSLKAPSGAAHIGGCYARETDFFLLLHEVGHTAQ